MKIYYMGLEPYNARYTLQLTQWNKEVFDRRGCNVVYVPGQTLDDSQKIVVGQVLDAHGRSYYSMSQTMALIQMMQQGKVSHQDVVYFEDMFQPGIESLLYVIDQVPADQVPRVYLRCLAQSIDPDDFVHTTGMAKWMGHYEKMVCELAKKSGGGILATNEEMVANIKIAGWDCDIYNISGLAFGKREVQSRVSSIKPFNERKKRVVFSARWDQEKQPNFYMDLIELWHVWHPDTDVEFCVCSGAELKSNNPEYVERALEMQKAGKLRIYQDLAKNDYYAILNDSRVVFNCALQDWVSNTVSEADALGCNVLYPAYRSFPEVFANDYTRLYVPWSTRDAVIKLDALLDAPHKKMGAISDWNDGTIDRVIDIFEGLTYWLRNHRYYREYVAEEKY